MTRIICGVDVSSSTLEARIGREGATGTFPNTPAGISALGGFCHAHAVELVAMEATGGYEKQAFCQLSEQGLPVAILNPRAVRRFAEGMGLLEKTDALDALLCNRFETLQTERKVGPTLGRNESVNFVDNHRVNCAQGCCRL